MTLRQPGPRRQLPKAYLRIDPNIDQTHPDFLDGFVRLLCAANRQPVRGVFRDRHVLDSLFGKTGTDRFYQRRDVRDGPEGTVEVLGWATWQEGDMTVGARMSRYRQRKSGVTTDVTDAVSPDVTTPLPDRIPASETLGRKGFRALSLSNESAPHRPLSEHQKTVAWLTGKGISSPSGWAVKGLQALAKGYGSDRVIVSFEEGFAAGRKTANGLVKYAEAELEPFVRANGAEEYDEDYVRRQLAAQKAAKGSAS